VNPDFQALADALERDRHLRAHRMTLEQRLIQGAALFDYACEAALTGLRAQFPTATDAELQVRLRRTLTRARELDGVPL
jgi:hypothetical protein